MRRGSAASQDTLSLLSSTHLFAILLLLLFLLLLPLRRSNGESREVAHLPLFLREGGHRVLDNDRFGNVDLRMSGSSRDRRRVRSEYQIGIPDLVSEKFVELVELLHVEDGEGASLEIRPEEGGREEGRKGGKEGEERRLVTWHQNKKVRVKGHTWVKTLRSLGAW